MVALGGYLATPRGAAGTGVLRRPLAPLAGCYNTLKNGCRESPQDSVIIQHTMLHAHIRGTHIPACPGAYYVLLDMI